MTDTAEQAARLAEEKLAPKPVLADAAPPPLSEADLAHRFARRHDD